MGIKEFFSSINPIDAVEKAVGSIGSIIDNLSTSDDERFKGKAKLNTIRNELLKNVLVYENNLIKAQSEVIKAEANGHSWLQRNWRPITMLTFLVLVVCDQFGLLTFRLSLEAWGLLKIGLGGYVVGRSAEKVLPGVVKAIKQKSIN